MVEFNAHQIMSKDISEILKEMTRKSALSIEIPANATSYKDVKIEPAIIKEVMVYGGFPKVDKIIYSGNKTIVLWKDKTKTIVSCAEGETYDEFDGFTAALAKKIYGSTCAVKREIRKHKQIPTVDKK